MARYLFLQGGVVINIVEAVVAPAAPAGVDTVTPALTGAESVGDNMANNLAYAQAVKQGALDAFLDANFDFKAFIRAGTTTTLTGAQVGTFIATIANNYRSLRAQIAAASTVAAVNAININSGWPANP